MKQYELLYIVPTTYADSEVENITKLVGAELEKVGATILQSQHIGKIKLAYPIKREKNGNYILVYFDAETDAIQKLDKAFRLMDEMLRHIIVERPEGAEKTIFDLKSYEAPIGPEGKKRKKDIRKDEGIQAQENRKPTGEPISMEELDKKLDEIVEGTKENV